MLQYCIAITIYNLCNEQVKHSSTAQVLHCLCGSFFFLLINLQIIFSIVFKLRVLSNETSGIYKV